MDPTTINILVGTASSVAMFVAIVFMLTYVVGSFSTKSRLMSPKVAGGSAVYFFGSTILLFFGMQWLNDLASVPADGLPFYLRVGAAVLALNSVLHVFCGLLVVFIFVRNKLSGV